MGNKRFDLTVFPHSQLFYPAAGLITIANGVFGIDRGDTVFGYTLLLFGFAIMFSNPIMHRMSKFVLEIEDDRLEIVRGLNTRVIPWEQVKGIEIQMMSVDVQLKNGKPVHLLFGDLPYKYNQAVKPEILVALRAIAASNDIPLRDSEAAISNQSVTSQDA